jgi:hypothetical protein
MLVAQANSICHLPTWEAEIRGSWCEANLNKKFTKPPSQPVAIHSGGACHRSDR